MLCCNHCGRFIGGVMGQLEGIGGAECALGCGVRYCTRSGCAAQAFACHSRLCVGPHTEQHPLYRYKLAAYRSGAYADFQLAAQLAVQAAIEPSRAAHLWQCAAAQRASHGGRWSPARSRTPRAGWPSSVS
jgi:hypothetical protein